jgi:hypothetical protein
MDGCTGPDVDDDEDEGISTEMGKLAIGNSEDISWIESVTLTLPFNDSNEVADEDEWLDGADDDDDDDDAFEELDALWRAAAAAAIFLMSD